MEHGRTNPEEKARNIEADKLATDGIAMNEADAVMIKATRQRKTITALPQTKLVKIWISRQDLAAIDEAEQQQQLDEEEARIAEMQKAFEVKEGPKDPNLKRRKKKRLTKKKEEGLGSS